MTYGGVFELLSANPAAQSGSSHDDPYALSQQLSSPLAPLQQPQWQQRPSRQTRQMSAQP